MTGDKIGLREMLEKGPDARLLREMIGFAAQRQMELEVGEVTGAAHGEHSPTAWCSATAIATATGRPVPARSNSGSRSSGAVPTSPPS